MNKNYKILILIFLTLNIFQGFVIYKIFKHQINITRLYAERSIASDSTNIELFKVKNEIREIKKYLYGE